MGFKDKFRKWYADDYHFIPRICRDITLWFKGAEYARVGLWTITYNAETQTQQMDYVRVSRKDLPAEAVHVTGKGWREYALDRDKSGSDPGPEELTAIDLYLFAKTDAFDESSLFSERRGVAIDTKTLGIVVGVLVGLAALWIIWSNFL